MADLIHRGFTEHFIPTDGRLRGVYSGQAFLPDAIETRSGVRGTLADAFGVHSDPRVSAHASSPSSGSARS
jgi:hypothetical protein